MFQDADILSPWRVLGRVLHLAGVTPTCVTFLQRVQKLRSFTILVFVCPCGEGKEGCTRLLLLQQQTVTEMK